MSMIWDTEEIYTSGDVWFEHILRDIDRARSYITVEMYIFNDDDLGKKVANHLIAAYRRGVKVQIVVDGIGSYGFFDTLNTVFRNHGIIVKMYNPLPFYHPFYGNLNLLRKFEIFGIRMLRLNNRNHRKIITIDQSIMFAGSFNITAEHTSLHREKPWKDMGVRVSGDYVTEAILNFKKVWKLRDYFRYRKQIKNPRVSWKQSPLRLNQTISLKNSFYRDFLKRVVKAQDRIWLMTPYFIPKRGLIRALGNAARRGVDVRLLISSRTDVKFFTWLQFFYYGYLLSKGVKVYQYTESVLHAKNYIIDDYITIGSTNLNHRSFLHDLEVDLVIQAEDNKKKACEHFLQSLEKQEIVTLEHLRKKPLWDRFLSRLFFLFKYWF